MIEIPKQLHHEDFRFVLLGKWDDIIKKEGQKDKPKGKIPFEKSWQKNGYKFNDKKLLNHIKKGLNFGVIGGYGNVRILDIDDKELGEAFEKKIDTYTIKTGGGGKHFYFLSDYNKNHVLVNELGELRANNYQVVSSPCRHPSGKYYEVIKDVPLAKISAAGMLKIIKPYLREEKTTTTTTGEEGKDTSRSGLEYRKIIALLREGKNKTQIFKVMKAYSKWASSPDQYKEMTYDKAFYFIKEEHNGLERSLKKQDEKHKTEEASQFFIRLKQAEKFVEKQPLFYDKSKIWWMWNFKDYCYEMVDEIDILNGISKAINIDTTNTTIRTEILNALKQIGRENMPKEAGKSWIQFKDMLVDVKTGKEFKANSKYFVTNPIPWEIGESEETPTIDKLFKEWIVMEGVQDESYINTLYEIIAYSGLQHQFLQRLFALQGTGSNGKGCYLKLIKKYLGEENICTSELKLLSSRQFESSALYKKQACIMGEVDIYDMQNTNLLKKLTGEDDIRYEFKGKTPFSEKSGTTCFMATNSLPVTPDPSPGFYRRWLIIDFPHVFPIGKEIIDEIPDKEFRNLAKKCIRICKELYEKKEFTNEGNIEERMQRYEARSNPLLRFIETEVIEDPEEHTIFKEFCKRFNDYLKNNRLRLMTKITISRALKREGFQVKGKKTTTSNGEEVQTTCVFGVKLEENITTSYQNLLLSEVKPHIKDDFEKQSFPVRSSNQNDIKSDSIGNEGVDKNQQKIISPPNNSDNLEKKFCGQEFEDNEIELSNLGQLFICGQLWKGGKRLRCPKCSKNEKSDLNKLKEKCVECGKIPATMTRDGEKFYCEDCAKLLFKGK